MPLIHEPRCPRCGHELPMRTLWEFATLEESYVIRGFGLLTDGGYLNRRVGITCPGCRVDFRVTQARIWFVRTLAWLALLSLTVVWIRHAGEQVRYATAIAGVVITIAALGWLFPRITPYLATVRPPRPNEVMSFPLKNAYRRSDNEI